MLARIFLLDAEHTLSELARSLELDPATVQREAKRLEDAGLISSRRVGRARLVRANADSPFYPELASLLRKAFGPVPLLREALAGVEGIVTAFVFGSWAERYLGEPGLPPQDVDVLVVGEPPRRDLAKALRPVAAQLEADVSPTVVRLADWDDPTTGFLRSVKSGPLVTLLETRQ